MTACFDPLRCDNCGGTHLVCENHPDRIWDSGLHDARGSCGCGAGTPCPVCSPGHRWSVPLFDAIAHGDPEHRAWLLEAIRAFFAGASMPPVRGKGSTESSIAQARQMGADTMQALIASWLKMAAYQRDDRADNDGCSILLEAADLVESGRFRETVK